MKLFTRFSTRVKAVLGTAVAIGAIVALVVPAGTQAALGDDRPTKAYVEGMQGFDHVTFNSFTNVPNIGDERNFFTGKISGADGGFYDPMNNVKAGDELLVRVYVHNNADNSKNADGSGVARNTRVRVALPTSLNQNQTASAFISADNAQPAVIEDTLSLTGATPIGLQYVPGSAAIKTDYQNVPLSDEIVTTGVKIGDSDLSGNFKGCFEYVARVTFKVKVTAPSYSLQKSVRVNGTTNFGEEVSVKPGDKVDFALGFKNTGTTSLRNVVLGDRLPVGMTYVPGTTEWISGHTGDTWAKVDNDQWLDGGLNVGGYAPGAGVFLRFTAQVADASQLECGMTQLVNHGFTKPEGQGTIQDSATVKVTKECATPTPVYACDMLDVIKSDSRTVTVKEFKYTARDGATLKHVVINWGDGTDSMVTSTAGHKHQYAKDGTYTIKATPYFTVNGNDVTAPENPACAETIEFTTPVTPVATTTPTTPTELPNVGAGNVAALFGLVSVVSAVAHRLFLSRRPAR